MSEAPDGPIERFDRVVDSWFDPLRAIPPVDHVFYAASHLGDFSLIWHLLSAYKGLAPGNDPRDAVELSLTMVAESAIVNWGIKSLFRRVRPPREHDPDGRSIRQPLTSSFPSGHASAAMTAAAVLGRDSRWKPLYYGVGAVVAASRIHVRMHHASDVVAGAATGFVLGKVAVGFWERVRRS